VSLALSNSDHHDSFSRVMLLVQDIIEKIVDELKDNHRALRALALTGSIFRDRAQHHIFHTLRIYEPDTLSRLTTLFSQNAELPIHVRKLELGFDKASLFGSLPNFRHLVCLTVFRLGQSSVHRDIEHDLPMSSLGVLQKLVLSWCIMTVHAVLQIASQATELEELALQSTVLITSANESLSSPRTASANPFLHLKTLKLIYNDDTYTGWWTMQNFSPVLPLLSNTIEALHIHTMDMQYRQDIVDSIAGVFEFIGPSLRHVNVSGFSESLFLSSDMEAN
jgi:hypothetical protein